MKPGYVMILAGAVAWILIAVVLTTYGAAHSEVARECDRLGGFYVGDQIYECKRKTGEAQP